MTKQQHTQPLPHWRSVLFIPAHIDRFVESAHKRNADAVVLDLEDSVPLDSKQQARDVLAQQVAKLSEQNIDVLVRVNRDLKNCLADLEAAVIANIKAITIPKAMGPEHIRLLDETITDIERSKGLPIGDIKLIAMIESIEALLSADKIAHSCIRLAGLLFGTEDLSLDGGFEPSEENLFHPAQKLIYAAKLANIRAYGFPGSIADYSDADKLNKLIVKAKSMGFDGAFCIHPNQVQAVNEIYQISEQEIQQAQKIVDAYKDAIKKNRAAVEVDGKMVDWPVVERAKKVLESQN